MAILDLDLDTSLRSFALSLELRVGPETLALVGPSGAGKTTTLLAIAGLARPDRGRIAVDDRPWFDSAAGVSLPPEERSVGLVFQEYALFPHMSVWDNIAFGGRGAAAGVGELLERFRISHLAAARPGTLSGGERQRVALARALARDPEVLLLDEPLSALDAQTRPIVRAELQDLLAGLGLPTLLITHDFDDAAALADRAGAIVDGRVRQLAPVAELADRPADAFVASLTGSNVLAGVAGPRPGGGAEVRLDDGQVLRSDQALYGRVGVVIAPWAVRVRGDEPSLAEPPTNSVRGLVRALTPAGDRVELRIGEVRCRCPVAEVEGQGVREGAPAWAVLPPEAIRLVPLDD